VSTKKLRKRLMGCGFYSTVKPYDTVGGLFSPVKMDYTGTSMQELQTVANS